MLSIDLPLLASRIIYRGLQIFAELDSPILNADRVVFSFSLLLVLNTEGTALKMKMKTLGQFVKQKIMFFLDNRVNRSIDFKQQFPQK